MFAVDGEGGLQLNLQELATIRANQLPITLFVINNGVIAQSEIRRQTIFLGDLWELGLNQGFIYLI